MTHLTLCGYYAGRPLCETAAKERGDTFQHAMYADLAKIGDLCPECEKVWNSADDDEGVSTSTHPQSAGS